MSNNTTVRVQSGKAAAQITAPNPGGGRRRLRRRRRRNRGPAGLGASIPGDIRRLEWESKSPGTSFALTSIGKFIAASLHVATPGGPSNTPLDDWEGTVGTGRLRWRNLGVGVPYSEDSIPTVLDIKVVGHRPVEAVWGTFMHLLPDKTIKVDEGATEAAFYKSPSKVLVKPGEVRSLPIPASFMGHTMKVLEEELKGVIFRTFWGEKEAVEVTLRFRLQNGGYLL
nr:MAG: hypothetical protein [Grapevine umbra-like virus 4]WRQ19802.1 MAG: hypothetical protein [Grapevine umbra-like virus 4]